MSVYASQNDGNITVTVPGVVRVPSERALLCREHCVETLSPTVGGLRLGRVTFQSPLVSCSPDRVELLVGKIAERLCDSLHRTRLRDGPL